MIGVQVSPKLRRGAGRYFHWCPGCNEMHPLPDRWTFDGNLESPTFAPSFRQGGVRHTPEGDPIYDAAGNLIPRQCHYNLVAGQLQFHDDSVHALKGKTVPLPDLPQHLRD